MCWNHQPKKRQSPGLSHEGRDIFQRNEINPASEKKNIVLNCKKPLSLWERSILSAAPAWWALENYRFLWLAMPYRIGRGFLMEKGPGDGMKSLRVRKFFYFPQMTQMAQICAGRMYFSLTGLIFRNKRWFVLLFLDVCPPEVQMSVP